MPAVLVYMVPTVGLSSFELGIFVFQGVAIACLFPGSYFYQLGTANCDDGHLFFFLLGSVLGKHYSARVADKHTCSLRSGNCQQDPEKDGGLFPIYTAGGNIS